MADRERIQDAWNEIAPGDDEFVTCSNVDSANVAHQHTGLRSEARVLDVAAGSGASSLPAARRSVQVLAMDVCIATEGPRD